MFLVGITAISLGSLGTGLGLALMDIRRQNVQVAQAATVQVSQAELHAVLVKARNSVDKIGWSIGWGGCIMRHVAEGVGWGTGMPLQDYEEVISHPVGVAAAKVMGFEHPGKAMTWNDGTTGGKTAVINCLDRAIMATAPLPADPTLGMDASQIQVTDSRPDRHLVHA